MNHPFYMAYRSTGSKSARKIGPQEEYRLACTIFVQRRSHIPLRRDGASDDRMDIRPGDESASHQHAGQKTREDVEQHGAGLNSPVHSILEAHGALLCAREYEKKLYR